MRLTDLHQMHNFYSPLNFNIMTKQERIERRLAMIAELQEQNREDGYIAEGEEKEIDLSDLKSSLNLYLKNQN